MKQSRRNLQILIRGQLILFLQCSWSGLLRVGLPTSASPAQPDSTEGEWSWKPHHEKASVIVCPSNLGAKQVVRPHLLLWKLIFFHHQRKTIAEGSSFWCNLESKARGPLWSSAPSWPIQSENTNILICLDWAMTGTRFALMVLCFALL